MSAFGSRMENTGSVLGVYRVTYFFMGKEEVSMKRLVLVLVLGMFLAGCGTAADRSEFWKHPTMFAGWDHMNYSWGGYEKDCGPDQTKKTKEQKWWGEQYNECAPK